MVFTTHNIQQARLRRSAIQLKAVMTVWSIPPYTANWFVTNLPTNLVRDTVKISRQLGNRLP